jgi:dimethylglycine dehydrogenase
MVDSSPQSRTFDLGPGVRRDERGSEPIYFGGELVGRTTSGGFGWRVGKSLALGMVRPDLAGVGTEVEVAILGESHAATVIADSPFDPDNVVLRD